LQRSERGDGQRRGFGKSQPCRLGRQRLRRHRCILGKRAAAKGFDVAVDRIARLEERHAAAHRFDAPGQVGAEPVALGLEESFAEARQEDVGGKQVPVQRVDRCRVNLDQHLARFGGRLLDFLELEHIGRAVLGVGDCFH
jgi:hypothetical protein